MSQNVSGFAEALFELTSYSRSKPTSEFGAMFLIQHLPCVLVMHGSSEFLLRKEVVGQGDPLSICMLLYAAANWFELNVDMQTTQLVLRNFYIAV